MDSAQKNIPGYKNSFTKNSTKGNFVKRTPFTIVKGLSDENLASRGMKRTPYPTPKQSVK